MGFEDILRSLEGSVNDLSAHDVKISQPRREQIRKRVTEAVVRHVLKKDSRIELYSNNIIEEGAALQILYKHITGRIQIKDQEGHKLHEYSLMGTIREGHDMPFFGEIMSGNIDRAHVQMEKGFELMDYMFSKGTSHGILFGNFNKYQSKKLKKSRRNFERQLTYDQQQNSRVVLAPTNWEQMPTKFQKVKQIYGDRIHLVDIGKYMKGSGKVMGELLGLVKDGKMYED